MWDIDILLKRLAGGSKTTETVKLCLSNQSGKKPIPFYTVSWPKHTGSNFKYKCISYKC